MRHHMRILLRHILGFYGEVKTAASEIPEECAAMCAINMDYTVLKISRKNLLRMGVRRCFFGKNKRVILDVKIERGEGSAAGFAQTCAPEDTNG